MIPEMLLNFNNKMHNISDNSNSKIIRLITRYLYYTGRLINQQLPLRNFRMMGILIKKRMRVKNVTISDISNITGMGNKYVKRFLNGYMIISFNDLKSIIDYLEMDLATDIFNKI